MRARSLGIFFFTKIKKMTQVMSSGGFFRNVTSTFEKSHDKDLIKAKELRIRNLNHRIDQAQVVPLANGVVNFYRDDLTHPDIRIHEPKSGNVMHQRDQIYNDIRERQLDSIQVTINETRAPGTVGLDAYEVANGLPIKVMSGRGILVNLRHPYKIGGDPTIEHRLGEVHGWGRARERNVEPYISHRAKANHLKYLNGETKALRKDYNINRINNERLRDEREPDWYHERILPIVHQNVPFPLSGGIPGQVPYILNLNKYAFL